MLETETLAYKDVVSRSSKVKPGGGRPCGNDILSNDKTTGHLYGIDGVSESVDDLGR